MSPSESKVDSNRWAEFVREMYPQLIRQAYVITRSPQVARDLVHQAFLHFMERPFEEYVRPHAYLHGILRNLARSHFRRVKRGAAREVAFDLDLLPAPDSEEWKAWDVQRVWQRLEPAHREVFELLAEGLKTQEIADRLGIKYSTAAVRIHRLSALLQKLINS